MDIIHWHAGARGPENMPERIGGMSLLSLFSRSPGGTGYAQMCPDCASADLQAEWHAAENQVSRWALRSEPHT